MRRLFAGALLLVVLNAGVCAADIIFKDGFESGSSCRDADGDGWATCEGDCCDDTALCSVDPAAVNPGAFEVAGNAVDDDCDPATPDTGLPACDGGLASNSNDPVDYARAIDLCSFTVESPQLPQRRWGVISGGFFLADGTSTPAAASRSIRQDFGSGVVPLAGDRIVVLATGNAAAKLHANPPYASPDPGLNKGTSSPAPADWLAANGGGMPGTPGCPSPIGGNVNDPMLLKLRVRVPTNARSFSVRAFFYSSEFPEWVCSPYNDFFLTLLDSRFVPAGGEEGNPADKNLAMYDPPPAGGSLYPVGPNLAYDDTGGFRQCVNGMTGCASGQTGTINTCIGVTQLAGTGFEDAAPGSCDPNSLVGGGTGWLTIRGNVEPGETIELRFVVWDTSDAAFDSTVLLDDFRWSLTSATPGTN